MDPALLTIIAAMFLGLNASIIRKAVNKHPFSLNSFTTFLIASIVMWIFALLVKSPLPSVQVMPYFVLAGILAPGFAAIFNFESFKRVGVAYTSSLLATTPLFGAALALILLKERINFNVGIGTILVVLGVFLMSWFRPKKHIKLKDLAFPVAGAALIGIATVLIKFGLNISNLPYSAIAISTSSGVLILALIITFTKKWGTISFVNSKYFIVSGLVLATGLLILYTALAVSNVVVVLPLMHTQALFALIFAWFLFGRQEHITRYTISGTMAIVFGALLISVSV